MKTIEIQGPLSRIYPRGLLIILAVPLVLLTAIGIVEAKWSYLGLLFAVLLIYVSLKKPFIFPFGLYVFSIPFETLLVMSGSSHGATVTRVLGIITILILALKSYFEKKLRVPYNITLWWVFFAFYCFLSATWSLAPDSPLVRIQTITGLVVLYIVVSAYRVQKKEYDMLTWFILSGGALSAILIIYGYHKGMAEFGDVARVSLASLKNDSGSGSADNGLSFTMLLPVSICLGMLLKKGKPLMKIFFFAVLLILFFGVILTGSRGNLAGCLVILLYFFIFTRK